MSKPGVGKKEEDFVALNQEAKDSDSGSGEFVAFSFEVKGSEPSAEEFISFDDFWRSTQDGKAQNGDGQRNRKSGGDDSEKESAQSATGTGGRERGGQREKKKEQQSGKQKNIEQGNSLGESSEEEPSEEEPSSDPVELARLEAERVLAEAEKEALKIREEAKEQGLLEGRCQGESEGRKEYAAKSRELQKILLEIQAQRRAVIQRYREDLLTLVKAMTDRLVQYEVSLNPLVIKACFRNAMEYVVENSLVKAHLSPESFQHLKEEGLNDPSLFGGRNRVQLLEDPSVAPGGCRLESTFGEVDATLESCREKLYQDIDRAFQAALEVEAAEDEPPLPDEELEAVLPPPPSSESSDDQSGDEPSGVSNGSSDSSEAAVGNDPTATPEVEGDPDEPAPPEDSAQADDQGLEEEPSADDDPDKSNQTTVD